MVDSLQLEDPIAQRLADLAGVQRDLELAKEACELFLGMPHVGSRNAIALSNAVGAFALITYFRTVANGARGGITAAQIASLPQTLRTSHERLKAVRSQYIAHSINRQEENKVVVTLNANGSLASLGTDHSRPATYSTNEISDLMQLIDGVTSIVNTECDLEFDRVWDYLEALNPEDRARALTPMQRGKPFDWRLKQRRFRT